MPERDQSRHLAVGAGASPADPDVSGDDVVQAVADFVDDLVDDADADPPSTGSST